ncbi:sensor histidine kinase [uncultured Amnibacterium sp.]|uniref:sensor histidine kinase n=1 Tax=uncultured Amnibacterium sp. TaxID=1631851 RepID=UPI0035CBF583
MDRILRQRDRLLQVSARLIGLTSTAVALLLLALPGVLPTGLLLLTLPLFAALAGAQFRMGMTKALAWPVVIVGVGLALLILLRLEGGGVFGGWPGAAPSSAAMVGIADAMQVLAAGAIGSASILLTINLGRMLLLLGMFGLTLIVVVSVFAGDPGELTVQVLSTIAGWAGLVAIGSVLSAGLLQAARRISSIGRAHRNERHASETEAQRRQGARLLHDTVLATLTLLAHSGVGVATGALRSQAGDDARLLRQLRLSAVPMGSATGGATGGAPVAEIERDQAPAIDPLESVKTRFSRLGLDVSWHGAGTVRLSGRREDAFLGALSECLENVRRHSGVGEAHVTVTDDTTMVRALVTDNGIGFDPSAVASGRLGYEESVVGRLREVGGNARVFSAQGSGTTVVLEVPR